MKKNKDRTDRLLRRQVYRIKCYGTDRSADSELDRGWNQKNFGGLK